MIVVKMVIPNDSFQTTYTVKMLLKMVFIETSLLIDVLSVLNGAMQWF